jgi:hypothetical protein
MSEADEYGPGGFYESGPNTEYDRPDIEFKPWRYRKKPVVIEARQLGQDYDTDCEIVRWCGGKATGEHGYLLYIKTLEGTMGAGPGDWIIKGVNGEFYPCKDNIFKQTYEQVGP